MSYLYLWFNCTLTVSLVASTTGTCLCDVTRKIFIYTRDLLKKNHIRWKVCFTVRHQTLLQWYCSENPSEFQAVPTFSLCIQFVSQRHKCTYRRTACVEPVLCIYIGVLTKWNIRPPWWGETKARLCISCLMRISFPNPHFSRFIKMEKIGFRGSSWLMSYWWSNFYKAEILTVSNDCRCK